MPETVNLPDAEFVSRRLGGRVGWIPIRDGERQCLRCGVYWSSHVLECGCAYCSVCWGRDKHEDHGQPDGDECDAGTSSPAFVRADHDCLVCEQRHPDWERCAEALRAAIRARNERGYYEGTRGA